MAESPRHDWVLVALLTLSLCTNVLLALSVLRSRPAVDPSMPQLTLEVAAGSTAPKLSGASIVGTPRSISFGSTNRPKLIYVFTTSCPWCKRNAANIRTIIGLEDRNFDVYGVAIEDDPVAVRLYLEQFSLSFDEVVLPDLLTRQAYGFGVVPTTLVVGRSGKIINSWRGAYSARIGQEIASALGATFPELASVRSSIGQPETEVSK